MIFYDVSGGGAFTRNMSQVESGEDQSHSYHVFRSGIREADGDYSLKLFGGGSPGACPVMATAASQEK